MPKVLKKIQKILAWVWFTCIQIATIPVNFILTKLLKLTIERPRDFHITHGTLIIANHQSKIDPFLISYHIGARNWKNIVPIRYPVTPDYMTKPIMGFIISLLGGYNIGSTVLERLQKLVFTRELLREKYTIVIFPEGKITRDSDMVDEFKKGAYALFNENYPVVFVRLTGLNEKHKFHFWKNTRAKLSYSTCYDTTVTKEEKVNAMMEFFGIHEEINSGM